jgi:2-desacetyl-2-hydroxyethyl bacteriochlorophyllide A dehydrogenase
MWTSTLQFDPTRVLATQLLGRFWRGAYFSRFAPLQVHNLPRQPLPATSWVRVRNRLAGICGSDLHLIYVDGDFHIAPAAIPSHGQSYPGHEVVGEVVEVGEEVEQLQVGDRVVLEYGPNCLSAGLQPLCRACASAHYSLCERGMLPGPHPIGGGWSEEMLLHEQQVFRISPRMSDEQAVLLEPTSVAVHAVLRHLPQVGDKVLIIGAGTIGLLILQALQALAPQTEVSVMARHAFQVELATRLRATHILYPQDSYQGVQKATGATLFHGIMGNRMLLGGYDVIYDTVGTQHTLHDALRWTRAGGSVVLVGVSLHTMHLDLSPIWYQEVNLVGTLAHGMEIWPTGSGDYHSTFAVAAELIEQSEIDPEQLISHRFALTQFKDALLTASQKSHSRATKVVFDYSLLPTSSVPNVHASARQNKAQIHIPATIGNGRVTKSSPGALENVGASSQDDTSGDHL